ncbi:hypothetical protein F4808DRAFT_421673 [Astrocystis sublimbata]|nr:hypothetical protein F4808DRAFT_421673 [Astrocystis sublimbata]
MHSWMMSAKSSKQNYKGLQVWETCTRLLFVSKLRNVVCHPRKEELRDVKGLDCLLETAQIAIIYLGDAQRALQIRDLRDNLHAMACEEQRQISNLVYLLRLPYYEAEHEDRRLKMLQHVLRVVEGFKDFEGNDQPKQHALYHGYYEFLKVARAWEVRQDAAYHLAKKERW